jgi:hypothetical protein
LRRLVSRSLSLGACSEAPSGHLTPHLVDHQVRGTEVASAKLTDENVRAIRREERTRAEIGAAYGISKATVSSIWARRT